jgi:hypothetical protein
VSGAYPYSLRRTILDASKAPVNALGISDNNGTVSRYKNMNANIYHLTGWWDIFIDGQIKTFNHIRNENPATLQKLVIGPWTHQTIGLDSVGDVVYPSSVFDVLKMSNIDNLNPNFFGDSSFFNNLFSSELLKWFRANLGGEPFFIISESNSWQPIDSNLIRIPSKNFIIPYYQFLNYIGGQGTLDNLPIEIDNGSTIISATYNIPPIDSPVIALPQPLTAFSVSFNDIPDVRIYINGPTNDTTNIACGNYWIGLDSLPFKRGIKYVDYYLHQNNTLDTIAPLINEGVLSYVNDPNNPVITTGGNNMIVRTPQNDRHSQGSMNYADPDFAPYTMDRNDVLKFVSQPLSDTVLIIGFPKAKIYAKANSFITNINETNFDVFVRILDVYPDGREMFVTEGAVNVRARDYAESIYNDAENDSALFSNAINNQLYHLKFNLLPIGHVFGKGHKIKVLISSSNFPHYQSNPQIPLNDGEFFRWRPGDTTTYVYQGNVLSPAPSTITVNFDNNFSNTVSFPVVKYLPNISLPVTEINNVSENDFALFPNPTLSVLNIKYNVPINQSRVLNIYNLNGQLIMTYPVKNQLSVINVEHLTEGVYLISDDKTGQSKLFVKSK